jgi:hypothetical protein
MENYHQKWRKGDGDEEGGKKVLNKGWRLRAKGVLK